MSTDTSPKPARNLLQSGFARRRESSQSCLLPYVTAAYPDPETTVALLARLQHPAIGAVELGIPYSDPIADGPVIQTSFCRALESGFQLDALFAALKNSRNISGPPLIAMVSYSIMFRRGAEAFVAAAAEAGIEGLIVPDLAWEEAPALADAAHKNGISLILIVAPTTPLDRARKIAQLSSPFTYYQASAGVTGERGSLATGLAARVAQLRQASGKPVCAGFGISTPEQVRQVCNAADGAIVGSAIVRRMNELVEQATPRAQFVEAIGSFVDELADAAQNARG